MFTGEQSLFCHASSFSSSHLLTFSSFRLQVTKTECAKQLSFRSEEKCEEKPDKECRIKTKIVQVPEEQIKMVSFLLSSHSVIIILSCQVSECKDVPDTECKLRKVLKPETQNTTECRFPILPSSPKLPTVLKAVFTAFLI